MTTAPVVALLERVYNERAQASWQLFANMTTDYVCRLTQAAKDACGLLELEQDGKSLAAWAPATEEP